MTNKTLRQRIQDATRAAEAIMRAAEAAGRALTREEQGQVDQHLAEARTARDELQRAQGGQDELRQALREMGLHTQAGGPAHGSGWVTADGEPAAVVPATEAVSRHVAAVRGGDRDLRGFSVGHAIAALAFGDRFKRNLSAEMLAQLGEGTDSAGGFTVPEPLAVRFIDRVRNSMRVIQAGAVTVPMDSNVLHMARLLQPGATPAAAWKVENDPATASMLAFDRVTFTARTLPILVKLSVELSEDSVNIHQVIEREFSQGLALELDRAALRGDGTGVTPQGIRFTPGVTIQELGTGDGAVVEDYDWLVDAIGGCWEENFEPTARLYAARTAKTLAKLKDTTGQPLRAPDAVTTVPQLVTNQIPTALTVGASSDTSEAYVADFRELMIGMRTTFRLEVSKEAGDAFERLQLWVRAYLRADIQLAHPEAFVVSTGLRE